MSWLRRTNWYESFNSPVRWTARSFTVTTCPWQASTWDQIIFHLSTWGRTLLHSSMFLFPEWQRRRSNRQGRCSSMIVTRTWRSGRNGRRNRSQIDKERKCNKSLALNQSKTNSCTHQETKREAISVLAIHTSQRGYSNKKRPRTCSGSNRWCQAPVPRWTNQLSKTSHQSSWDTASIRPHQNRATRLHHDRARRADRP